MLALVLALALPAFAQVGGGNIAGTIKGRLLEIQSPGSIVVRPNHSSHLVQKCDDVHNTRDVILPR